MTIIAIEGIDASAKKTQCELLAQALRLLPDRYKSVDVFDFPHYESLSGPTIKALLTGDLYVSSSSSEIGVPSAGDARALCLQALMLMNRHESYPMLLAASKSGVNVLILDRYAMSGLAFGSQDGIPLESLIDMHAALPKADLSILIDIPAAESAKRRPIRRDRYEEDLGFQDRVRASYLELFKDPSPPWSLYQVVVDGTGTIDQVHQRIMKAYRAYIKAEYS